MKRDTSVKQASRKVSGVIIDFLFEKRFYHELLNRINKVYSYETGTIAAKISSDSIDLHMNPDYINTLTGLEVTALLEHELLHICLLHPLRQTGLEREIFDTAADIAVNQMVRDLPARAIIFESYFAGKDDVKKFKEAEYYYKVLAEAVSKGDINKDELTTTDDHTLWEEQEHTGKEPEGEAEQKVPPEGFREEKMLVSRIVKEARTSSKGDLPSPVLEGIIEQLLVDGAYSYKKKWNLILRDFLKKIFYQKSLKELEIKPSKRRPSKKLGYPFPALRVYPKSKSCAAVIIDSSGSITGGRLPGSLKGKDKRYLSFFESFLHELHCLCNKEITIHLLFADRQVLKPLDLESYSGPEKGDLPVLSERIIRLARSLGCKHDGIMYNYSHKKQKLLFELLHLITRFNELSPDWHLPGLAGGTSFVEAVAAASQVDPDCIIYFTDSKDDGKLQKTTRPLLFVTTGKEYTSYPFAHYIFMEDLTGDDDFYR